MISGSTSVPCTHCPKPIITHWVTALQCKWAWWPDAPVWSRHKILHLRLEEMWPAGEGSLNFPLFVISSAIEQREVKEREVQEEEALLRLSLICSRWSFSDPGRADQRKKPEYRALEYFMTVENTATKVPLFYFENVLTLHITCHGTYY